MAPTPNMISMPVNKEASLTMVTLSPTSIIHIRSARFKATASPSKPNTITNTRSDQDQARPDANGSNGATEFTVFTKLPVEMQDEIWKRCVPLQPRTVELQSYLLPQGVEKNQVVTLSQVNQKTRAEIRTLHGYVDLKHRNFNRPVIFHPEVDILYLAHKSLLDNRWNKDKVRNCLEKAGILDKVRCVALFCKENALDGWTRELQQYTALELVFWVLEQVYPLGEDRNTAGLPPQSECRFEDVELDSGSPNRWEWSLGSLEGYRRLVQEYLVRGPEKITPHVILVREVWNCPVRY